MAQLKWKSWTFGDNQELFAFLGLNVLEDEGLALETAKELKSICDDLNLPFVFKASFDKANRSSVNSYRGPGMVEGLQQLANVKATHSVPIVTDIHEPHQASPVSEVADILQIPAFLCRQTDLIRAASEAAAKSNAILHVKKAQFLAAWDCKNIVEKIKECAPGFENIILCERGTSFGYNNLVVDMLSIQEMKKLGVPVSIDATHAVQLPGQNAGGTSAGGRREGVAVIASSAIAAGADGVFLEFHPEPDKAKCDGPSCLPLSEAKTLLTKLQKQRALFLS